ncbi:3-isopropylmalate dehydratase small subunit [soil metagenome]
MSDFEWVKRGLCYKLGHDVPHPGGVIPLRFITGRETDPAVLIPHLFEQTDPGFSTRCRPGDIIVTGRRFGMGPKVPGYIAMHALGLGLVCESMPVQAYRAAISEGLPVLNRCPGVLDLCESGHELEVDFSTGRFSNLTLATEATFAPIPPALHDLILHAGTSGWLANWWQTVGRQRETASESLLNQESL